MTLENITTSDFAQLKEARAAQIDAEFDAMDSSKKVASNKELSDLDDQKKTEREALKNSMKGEEAAEVADTFLQMDDAGLKTFLENFKDKSWQETAGAYAMYHVAVQVLCKRLGFDPGSIDGIYGTNKTKGTRKAVLDLQAKLTEKNVTFTENDGLLGPTTLGEILGYDDRSEIESNTTNTATTDIATTDIATTDIATTGIGAKNIEGSQDKIIFDQAKVKLNKAFPDLDLSNGIEWTEGCTGSNIMFAGSDGQIRYGDRVNGKQNGAGYVAWASGSKYEGDCVDDKKTGKGTYTRANGDKYEGDWVDDKRIGKGTYTRANGDKYEGDFYYGAMVESFKANLIVDITANYERWKAYFGSKKNPIDSFSLDIQNNTLMLDIDQLGSDIGTSDEYTINLEESDIDGYSNKFTESFYEKLEKSLKERKEKKVRDDKLKPSMLGPKI